MEEAKTNPVVDPMKAGLIGNPTDLDLFGKSLLDPFMMGNPAMKNGKGFFDPMGLDDPSFMENHANLYNKMREKNRYERNLKIERYKNKKRNWNKKIAYDCRKRVADTRLRIKGRFISKKVKYYFIKRIFCINFFQGFRKNSTTCWQAIGSF